jgi:hypothetical protein
VVESGSLENCCTFAGTVGSNPTLSAIFSITKFLRKGARVVELAALEML